MIQTINVTIPGGVDHTDNGLEGQSDHWVGQTRRCGQ